MAAIGNTPGDMLDAINQRAEAARERYLGQLSDPQLRTYSRHQYQRLLGALELRLENLRAQHQARNRLA
jgi:hypothetical protein